MTGVLEVDVVGFVRNYLDANMTGRFVTELPANLADVLPLARVQRQAGGDDGWLVDQAVIVTDWFAATSAEVRAFAYEGCTAFRDMRGQVIDGAVVGLVRKLSGPFYADYQNPAVRRHITLHQVFILTD